jgi:hypothetical protein
MSRPIGAMTTVITFRTLAADRMLLMLIHRANQCNSAVET